ncbi:LpxL/LpxP family acyltransferase [Janthinobacterium agaricidamnosum]|uniref:Bacterial lipid A biosynthesis acyltransferase family protein n=1 Tax=Janthinobacterium agaricidamnosum NBRC 102515 = DSM 9628 TaxID=1349767 RepID=W0VCK1_9BURK|nr:lipid A biosynthesis acyltransferase [Janthinobacterium agaricidamnosum]CDG85636.1 bacterial lipid A biosynthesis acyltransferase family protein [Janthinobacterium agaricidamnosum NBRC 102515 = DSM 9628]
MRILLGIMWLLHWLPLPLLGRFGKAVGSLLFIVMGPRRHIALTNLRLCMPELSEAERVVLARRHFQAYSRSVWERGILWWASEARLRRLIKVVPAFPGAAIASGPTILLCPHFVCLDVAGVATAMEISASSMYVQQKNDVFDQVLRKGRSRFRPVKLFTRQDGIKPIMRALRDGLPYFMLPDMDFGEKDAEFVPFFGMPAATLTATARIAVAAKAQLMPVIATFLPDYQGWQVTYYPAWDNYPGPDITAATRRMNQFIEEQVRLTPEQYFWTHKRFKTRPEGQPSLYDKNE